MNILASHIKPIKRIAAGLLAAAALISTAACGNTSSTANAASDTKEIVVGVSPVYNELANVVKTEFDKQNKDSGKTLKVKLFDDFVAPDTALNEGSININFYQHGIYLKQFNDKNGTNLKAIDPDGLFTYYMGIYSNKYDDLKDLPNGATVLIPNDAANRGRALNTLAANDLITLKDNDGIPNILDVSENPKNLKLTETDTLKEVKSLDDADAAVINAISVAQGGLDPRKNLGIEDKKESAKYSIVIAYKDGSGNDKNAELFEKAVKTDAIKDELEKEFKGAVVPTW